MKVYSSGGWTAAGSSVNGTANRYDYVVGTASGSYTGASNTTFPATYDAGYVDVWLNGAKLVPTTDFTATSGTQIVLASAASAGANICIVGYGTFSLANFSVGDANDVSLAGLSNGQVLAYNSTSGDFEPTTISTTPAAVSDQANSSTGYFALPSGTTAQRPGSAAAGYTRYNTTTGSLEFYDGTNWVSTNLIPTINSVTGTIYAGAASTLTLSLTNATDTIDVKYYEGGTLIATDSGVTVTSGSASSTVPSAVYGQTAGDTISIQVFNQDGTPSSNSVSKTVAGLPTGGTISSSGGYRYHTFSSSGTFTNTISGLSVDYLIVAGGGGGAVNSSGGGGAGGMISGSTTASVTSYSAVIGGGGSGATGASTQGQTASGNTGSNTTFSLVGTTVLGGGGAPAYDVVGRNGGSGSGSSGGLTAGSGTSGQGNSGATNGSGSYPPGGGGGGKGSAGSPSTSSAGGAGGAGAEWPSGSGNYYAGGGGGSGDSRGWVGGAGGIGGGGAGSATSANGGSGTANTGGGGGSAWFGSPQGNGGAGGSGIVIVRYAI